MKKKILGLKLLMLFFLSTATLLAQESKEQFKERAVLMNAEELKIQRFITQNMDKPIPQDYVNRMLASFNHTDHHDHDDGNGHTEDLTKAQKMELFKLMKEGYWRVQYFKINPTTFINYRSVSAAVCTNGGFEDDNNGFTGYSGESAWGSMNGYRYGDCDLLTIDTITVTIGTQVDITNQPTFTSDDFSVPEHFVITDNIADPNIPAIMQVNSGDHAIRINSDDDEPGFSNPQYGINKLIKSIVLSEDDEVIYFNYATVLQDPGSSHDLQKPTFLARLMGSDGLECDRICNSANSNDPFLDSNPNGTIRFKDWTCNSLQACGQAGDVVTLEFIASDCGQSAHWGYAYIDDICDTCTTVIDTCNYEGNIQLFPTDTCETLPMQVCGTFDLAVNDCDTSLISDIKLFIRQNGTNVTIGIPTYTVSNDTFCFTVDSIHFPSGTLDGEGFDFHAQIDFDFGANGMHTENDYSSNIGPNNDYIFGADCCPEFDLLTCCDLINDGSFIDPIVTGLMKAYRESMLQKYPPKKNFAGDDEYVDPCCNPCNYPTDSFPVYIMQDGMLISASIYTITWSHDPGNSSAYAYLLPNQETVVTVFNPADSCEWSDTLKIMCCEDTISIDSLCAWDPCENPNAPIPLNVTDASGNPMTLANYTFNWSNGSTSDAISVMLADLPIMVIVTEIETGCEYIDSFDIDCCPYNSILINSLCKWEPCSFPNAPVPLNVLDQNGTPITFSNYTFNWSNGSTSDATSAVLSEFPIIVTATEIATGISLPLLLKLH